MKKKWAFALHFIEEEVTEVHVVSASTTLDAYMEILKTEIKDYLSELFVEMLFSGVVDNGHILKKTYEELRSKIKKGKVDQFKELMKYWDVTVSDPKEV